MKAVSVEFAAHAYGKVKALNGVSFSVSDDEIFGLIGPDGAGKTTLIRAICTLLAIDSGNISVLGKDAQTKTRQIRSQLGYMPQRFSLYQDLSVEQNLHFFADLFQVPTKERKRKLDELYAFSRLGPFKKRLAGALSGGMKQKLALSCNLVHQPELLILDEPTFGVDPVSRQEFWQMLKNIQAAGTPILVSTAYMDEAEMCNRIALIHQGQIIAQDTPAAIVRQFPYHVYQLEGERSVAWPFLQEKSIVHNLQMFGHEIHVTFTQKPSAEMLEQWQKQCGSAWKNIQPIAASIEDVFLERMQP